MKGKAVSTHNARRFVHYERRHLNFIVSLHILGDYGVTE